MVLQPLPNGPVSPITRLERSRVTPAFLFEAMARISPFHPRQDTVSVAISTHAAVFLHKEPVRIGSAPTLSYDSHHLRSSPEKKWADTSFVEVGGDVLCDDSFVFVQGLGEARAHFRRRFLADVQELAEPRLILG